MQPDYSTTRTAQPSGQSVRDDRSIVDLIRELTHETRTLVRQEIELATTEAREKATAAGQDLGLIGAGGAVAYAGMLVLAIGLSLLLGTIMPYWLAFILVGTVVAVVGYGLAQRGLTALRQTNFALSRTSATLEEDKQWMREEMNEVKRGDPRMDTAERVHRAR